MVLFSIAGIISMDPGPEPYIWDVAESLKYGYFDSAQEPTVENENNKYAWQSYVIGIQSLHCGR